MLRTNEIADLCRATLKSKTASDEEKARAKKALRRFEKMDARRKSALEAIGQKPERKNFETDTEYGTAVSTYRAALDRHIIERDACAVLDDPSTSSLVRQRARERLASIGILDEAPAPELPAPLKQPKPPDVTTPRGQLSETEYAAERRREREFLDEIARLTAEDAAKKKENESVNSGSTK
jgi:hypothetical protein